MRTKITNTSGSDRYFGYVPPHGTIILDGGDVVVDGDLRTVLASGRGRHTRSRELKALANDETSGRVVVEAAPEPSSSMSSSSSV